jgi:predicted ribosome quality control (RQC) complex YloA/Tae2 family protein
VLSLRELRRAALALDARRAGARLERVVQHGASDLVLVLSGGAAPGRTQILLCCRPGFARLSELAKSRPAPATPPPFAQYLRAHLEGARLRGAALRGDDRQAELRFESAEGDRTLLLSILGPRSNVYLLGSSDEILCTLRPLEETRRDLAGGQPWRDPPSKAPSEGEDRFAEVEDAELLTAIESAYAEREARAGEDDRRRRITRALERERSALARKAETLQRDADEAAEAEIWQRRGELLKVNLGAVRPRAESVELADPASGESALIPLDPALGAAANLERCFQKSRKLRRQALRAGQELGVLAERLAEVEALRAELAALGEEPSAEALEGLAEHPTLRRLLARHAPEPAAAAAPKPKSMRGPDGREVPARLRPRRYRTSAGPEVWVGRSDDGNDFLTTRLARGRDLFFHLEGSPGSHVVLRVEGSGDPPQEAILEAAELAVHFSKQRGASRAAVHVAAIKDVSKPKGAKPGLVWVHRGRTVHLRRDPRRLEKILAARIED